MKGIRPLLHWKDICFKKFQIKFHSLYFGLGEIFKQIFLFGSHQSDLSLSFVVCAVLFLSTVFCAKLERGVQKTMKKTWKYNKHMNITGKSSHSRIFFISEKWLRFVFRFDLYFKSPSPPLPFLYLSLNSQHKKVGPGGPPP
jgi:hypothetical protein